MTRARDLADFGSVSDRLDTLGGSEGALSNRNIVINGAMQVAQRGTSSTGLGATSGYYTVDRFNPNFNATAGRLTMTQESITDLDGFTKCIKYACTTADTSIAASEYFIQTHAIEGQNLQHINKGTSSAKKLTLSFYVKGNAAATYVCELQDGNSREIAQTFSVTTSWNRVVLTFDGDTDSGGTIANSNATGLAINLWLHGGSTFNSGDVADLNTSWSAAGSGGVRAAGADSFFDSTSRTFFITGMQLEVGDTATDFEHRSFDDEEQRCLRYYYKMSSNGDAVGAGIWYGNNQILAYHKYPKRMRAAPTASFSGTGFISTYTNGSSILRGGGTGFDNIKLDSARLNFTTASNGTAGDGTMCQLPNGTYFEMDAEL